MEGRAGGGGGEWKVLFLSDRMNVLEMGELFPIEMDFFNKLGSNTASHMDARILIFRSAWSRLEDICHEKESPFFISSTVVCNVSIP